LGGKLDKVKALIEDAADPNSVDGNGMGRIVVKTAKPDLIPLPRLLP